MLNMTGKIKLSLRAGLVCLGLLAPAAVAAQACVETVDDTVTILNNGQRTEGQRIVDYIALISERDLFNSRGVRLNNIAAIIQQDRANIHKSGQLDSIDGHGDRMDSYFTTLERRAQISSATIFVGCYYQGESRIQYDNDIRDADLVSILWVVLFRLPDGTFGVYYSQVG